MVTCLLEYFQMLLRPVSQIIVINLTANYPARSAFSWQRIPRAARHDDKPEGVEDIRALPFNM
jgi:hypothetical protein